MNTIAKLFLVSFFFTGTAGAGDLPVVTSPTHGQKVAGFQMEATGQSLKGRFPFFAVMPLAVSPQTWIQPKIHSQGDDGSVIGWINFGTAENGAGQTFLVYLLACENPFDGKVIQSIPEGCVASEPVKVVRAK